MEVKEAVQMAREYIVSLFEHEELSNVGLEEVFLDHQENEWVVTIGFSRPWDYAQRNALNDFVGKNLPKRSFKVVRINDIRGAVESVRNWSPAPDHSVPF